MPKRTNNRKNNAQRVSTFEQLEQRRLMASINVADFGARPNDGVDDTSAIRAAINASSAGDTIVISGGRFDIRDTIELKSNRTYTGGGTIKRPAGQGFVLAADGANTNITVNNLTLDGGGLSCTNGKANGLTVTNSTIQNITGGWPNGNGILLTAGAENTKINNNKFINIMGETGIYGFTRYHNVEISNNYFDTVFEGIHLAYENGGDNLRVTNNTFIRTHRMAVELQGRNATNTLVEGNKASEWVNPYDGSFFLSIVNMGRNTIVRNNHASSGKFGQIDPRANDVPVGLEISGWGVTVEGNVIENFREGCHLMNIRDAVVRNNKFYNQTWMGIWRTGISTGDFNGTNLTIENNEIYNPKVTAFMFHGRSTGTVRNNAVYLFGNANEYTEASGGAFNGVNRAGNQVSKPAGSAKPYTGTTPPAGSGSNGNSGSTTGSAPVAPGNVKALAVGTSQINVTWSDYANNEKGMKLYRRNNDAGDDNAWVLVATLDANATAYNDGGLNANTNYSYKILAYNENGNSGWSNEHNAVTASTAPTAPSAPTALEATAKSPTRIDLTWADNANNESGYRVYRRLAGGNWELIATMGAGSNAYNDTTVVASSSYTYRVLAFNAVGNSDWSNERSATTDAAAVVLTKPTTPSGLQVQTLSSGNVNVQWDDKSNNETNFKLYRRDNNGGDDNAWELIATLDANTTSYVDGTAAAGMHYSYKAAAVNAAGASGWSNEHDARTNNNDSNPLNPQAPVALDNLTARVLNAKVVETNWGGVTNDTRGVKVYRREGSGQWVFIAQMDGQASSYKDGAIEGGKTYTYRAVQFNQLFHSSASNEGTVTTLPGAPDATPLIGNGNGLVAQYFNGENFNTPVLTRSEAVNFKWGGSTPASGVGADHFSVRWTGQILARYSENHTFYLTADDGVRLWVNGKLIIDNWGAQPEKVSVGKIDLEAGKAYDIKLEYFENVGYASCVLGWASRSQAYEVVPTTQLFSATASTLAAAA